jgi:hypothetical protein
MKKLLFLGVCLVVLASQPVLAQTGTPAVLTMRVMEEHRHTRLWINWPGREPELVEYNWNDLEGKAANAGRIYEAAIRRVYEQGYQLQGVIPGVVAGEGVAYAYSTLVFTKSK